MGRLSPFFDVWLAFPPSTIFLLLLFLFSFFLKIMAKRELHITSARHQECVHICLLLYSYRMPAVKPGRYGCSVCTVDVILQMRGLGSHYPTLHRLFIYLFFLRRERLCCPLYPQHPFLMWAFFLDWTFVYTHLQGNLFCSIMSILSFLSVQGVQITEKSHPGAF